MIILSDDKEISLNKILAKPTSFRNIFSKSIIESGYKIFLKPKLLSLNLLEIKIIVSWEFFLFNFVKKIFNSFKSMFFSQTTNTPPCIDWSFKDLFL